MNKATNDASASSSELTSQLNDLTGRVAVSYTHLVKGRIKPGGTRASVGGIAGSNAGTIENCAFDGVVSGTSQIGGIAGVNTVKGSINGCAVSGTVYGLSLIHI